MGRRAAEPLLQELLQTLRAEQAALVRGPADVLPELAASKARALEHLTDALRAAPAAARAVLQDQVKAAQQLNATNAALVAARINVNRARLDTLMSLAGHPAAGFYDVRGDRPGGALATRPAASA
jgi:flagellar biosynthesis/type III secretory pathway chaperone